MRSLFGILNLQSIWYFKQYPNDWWICRLVVAVIWVLDTLDVVVSTHALYFLLVETRIVGKFLALNQLDVIWSCKLHILLGTLVKIVVQAIYAVRLWKVRQLFHLSQVVPWFLAFIMACNVGTGTYLVYGVYGVSNFSDISTIKSEIIAVFSTITGVTFIISIAMCYYLNRSRASSTFPSTIAMLVALMRLILISGLVTSMCSTATLITFLMWPNALVFVAIDLMQPRLFINSLLAMLNARKELRNIQSSEILEPKGESQLRFTSECECSRGTEMPIVISMRVESESVES
ncbi:uncharacterized protein EV420DRAFT_1691037 [Desarmillaria tabescens]|uniref:DUF6534 domain-containing protein n=1 Tax=Armillaria tabescens TaxID=1929756 RepID=A0AA39K9E2_ARMTA|nr:uncharacterized protein EV420DRAFT_1691037 [Desarmillaria tabescens]KAK0457004.1 hypothetical protein EV420DRAFT_1691037 [Desarmillaria tabescens]